MKSVKNFERHPPQLLHSYVEKRLIKLSRFLSRFKWMEDLNLWQIIESKRSKSTLKAIKIVYKYRGIRALAQNPHPAEIFCATYEELFSSYSELLFFNSEKSKAGSR